MTNILCLFSFCRQSWKSLTMRSGKRSWRTTMLTTGSWVTGMMCQSGTLSSPGTSSWWPRLLNYSLTRSLALWYVGTGDGILVHYNLPCWCLVRCHPKRLIFHVPRFCCCKFPLFGLMTKKIQWHRET